MPLTSDLFKNNRQLQNCLEQDTAHIVANEPPFRRGENDRGEHVALIHTALRRVMSNPSFGLEEATETYGPKTAEVVRQFKAKQVPPILNKSLRQTVPDNIVGKQTIFALDQQAGKKSPKPGALPSAKPEATRDRQVLKQTFEKKLDVRDASDLGSDFSTIGQTISNLPGDILRALENPIESSDPDNGVVQSRQTAKFPLDNVMQSVVIDIIVRRLPNIVRFGSFILVREVNRSYKYFYGRGNVTDTVLVTRNALLLNFDLRGSRQVANIPPNRVSQPKSFVDPK